MWHIGIDLHLRTLVVAAVHDSGEVRPTIRLDCSDAQGIHDLFAELQPFRTVIEATGTYRWLYRQLAPMGTVLLAHPLRLRSMMVRRSKSDRLDAQLLAQLLRLDQIPLAYIPPEPYQLLRELVWYRAQLGRDVAQAKTRLRQLMARDNIQVPYKYPFGPQGLYWLSRQDFGPVGNQRRDHLIDRLMWTGKQAETVDEKLEELRQQFPQTEALLELLGVGLFTALMIVAEYGEVQRFRSAKQVGPTPA